MEQWGINKGEHWTSRDLGFERETEIFHEIFREINYGSIVRYLSPVVTFAPFDVS